MSGSLAVHDSSGNVFEDLGLPDPEGRLAKAEMARAVRVAIRDRGVSEGEAARLLGITQPEVSELMRGRLSRFSIKQLARFSESF